MKKVDSAKPVNWDDVRVFLAVARAGQMLAAARKLGLDHATVGRHLTALEASLGTRLVERRARGCKLTEGGSRLLIVAERVESELLHAQSELIHAGLSIAGTVTISLPDCLISHFLSRDLGPLLERYPELSLKLVSSAMNLSLSKREADIAITTERPSEGRLTVRKLVDFSTGLFVSSAYIERNGTPGRTRDLRDAVRLIIGRDERIFDLLGDSATTERPGRVLECSNLAWQIQAMRDGLGVGLLPNFVAAQERDLVPVLNHLKLQETFWIVTHLDVRKVRRISEVHRFLLGVFSERADTFSA